MHRSNMNDPLSQALEEIRKTGKASSLQIFCGYLAEDNNALAVHWNLENGGDWKEFLVCAKTVGANILYLNWAPFEQFEIDDAVSKLESEITEDTGPGDDKEKLLSQVRAFQQKVGLTCVIDLAFVANGVVHIYQETADWFDEFRGLIGDDDEDDDETEERKPINKAVVNKWATALAGDPKFYTSKQREYLLEKLAGEEFSKLPIYEILRRTETIFEVDFKQAAEGKLAEEIWELRNQGLNLSAIALKLGIPRDRVSGLMSVTSKKTRT